MKVTSPVFKDKSIHEKSKYTIVTRLGYMTDTEACVEIEYLHPDANWHLLLTLEDDLKEMEKAGEDVSMWAKYRKWQKRKKYTIEEFNRIFEIK